MRDLYDRIDEIVACHVYTASAQEAIDYLKANLTTADIAEHMEGVAEEYFKTQQDEVTETSCETARGHAEIEIKDFLAYAKTPPKPKRKFPFEEWARILIFTIDHEWQPDLLGAVDRKSMHPFDGNNLVGSKIAPFDKSYIGKTKPHPDQITVEDLKDYDLSEWEKGE